MNELTLIQKILLFAPPILLAITVHEAAHGYAAKIFGDRTAEMMGRLTLNPIKHIDPIGTILVPGALLLLGSGILFGWAKPVPVQFGNLKQPKQDMVWVALAGPLSNLAMAVAWGMLLKIASLGLFPVWLAQYFFDMAATGITINLILLVLNMLPLPPLDGGRVVTGLLPYPQAEQFAKLEKFGFPILLGLAFTGLLGSILGPIMGFLRGAILLLFGFGEGF